MNGKWPAIVLVLTALGAGAGMWYAQEYGFYAPVDPASEDLTLTRAQGGRPAVADRLAVTDFQAIDAASSPVRYRACFRLAGPVDAAAAVPFADATPLIGPGWFDCFDAGRITRDLQDGRARAYLSRSEIRPDVDRIIALYPDGRGFAWHQLNDKTPPRKVLD